MAPYAIAHLKLSQFLADNDVPLKQDERINIFLTNTLEQLSKQIELPMMPNTGRRSESSAANQRFAGAGDYRQPAVFGAFAKQRQMDSKTDSRLHQRFSGAAKTRAREVVAG